MTTKNKEQLKRIQRKLLLTSATVYMSYGHLFALNFDEAKKTTEESKEMFEQIHQLIKTLIKEK